MSHRTAGRQRFSRPVHNQRSDRDQGALLIAATRRATPASGCADAATWLTGRDKDRVLSFDDIAADDPDQTWALSTGDAHASARDMQVALSLCMDVAFDIQVALVELATLISDIGAFVDERWHPLGKSALRVLFDDPGDSPARTAFAAPRGLLADVPFPTSLAAMMLVWWSETDQSSAPVVALSDVDHRPVVPAVGYDLETAVSA